MLSFEVENEEDKFRLAIEKFIVLIPKKLQYSKDNIWTDPQDQPFLIGITDFFQLISEEIKFVEFLKGTEIVTAGDIIGLVESLEATLEIISPITGAITKINHKLGENPELLNSAPYTKGWICTIQPLNLEDTNTSLINAEDYVTLIKETYTQFKERDVTRRSLREVWQILKKQRGKS